MSTHFSVWNPKRKYLDIYNFWNTLVSVDCEEYRKFVNLAGHFNGESCALCWANCVFVFLWNTPILLSLLFNCRMNDTSILPELDFNIRRKANHLTQIRAFLILLWQFPILDLHLPCFQDLSIRDCKGVRTETVYMLRNLFVLWFHYMLLSCI